MEKLVKLNAVAVPLPIDNLDTDQIMPKQFLRGVDKSGLAKARSSICAATRMERAARTAFSISPGTRRQVLLFLPRISAAGHPASTLSGADADWHPGSDRAEFRRDFLFQLLQ